MKKKSLFLDLIYKFAHFSKIIIYDLADERN